MSTEKQIQANRLNAQKSTGPRTEAGKAISCFNAIKYGINADSMIIPGEDPEQLYQIGQAYHADCRPATVRELALVQTLIRSDWFMRRHDRVEAIVTNSLVRPKLNPDDNIAEIYLLPEPKLQSLRQAFRRRNAAQKDWFHANTELQILQKKRRLEESRADTAAPAPPAEELSPEEPIIAEPPAPPPPPPEIRIISETKPIFDPPEAPQPPIPPPLTPADTDDMLK